MSSSLQYSSCKDGAKGLFDSSLTSLWSSKWSVILKCQINLLPGLLLGYSPLTICTAWGILRSQGPFWNKLSDFPQDNVCSSSARTNPHGEQYWDWTNFQSHSPPQRFVHSDYAACHMLECVMCNFRILLLKPPLWWEYIHFRCTESKNQGIFGVPYQAQ